MVWSFNLLGQKGNAPEIQERSNKDLLRENEICVHQTSLNVKYKRVTLGCKSPLDRQQEEDLQVRSHCASGGRTRRSVRVSEGRKEGSVEEEADSWQEVTTLNHFVSTSHYTPNLPLTPPFSSSPHPPSSLLPHFWSWLPCKVEKELCVLPLTLRGKKTVVLSCLALGKVVLLVLFLLSALYQRNGFIVICVYLVTQKIYSRRINVYTH